MASHDVTDTLCATCTRCRALPDPAGCAFHRRHWQTRQIEGHPYQRAETRKYNNGFTAIFVQLGGDNKIDEHTEKHNQAGI